MFKIVLAASSYHEKISQNPYPENITQKPYFSSFQHSEQEELLRPIDCIFCLFIRL